MLLQLLAVRLIGSKRLTHDLPQDIPSGRAPTGLVIVGAAIDKPA
jgi:hypothetical protein